MKIFKVRVNEIMVYNIKARDAEEAMRTAMGWFDNDFGQSISYVCEIL